MRFRTNKTTKNIHYYQSQERGNNLCMPKAIHFRHNIFANWESEFVKMSILPLTEFSCHQFSMN